QAALRRKTRERCFATTHSARNCANATPKTQKYGMPGGYRTFPTNSSENRMDIESCGSLYSAAALLHHIVHVQISSFEFLTPANQSVIIGNRKTHTASRSSRLGSNKYST